MHSMMHSTRLFFSIDINMNEIFDNIDAAFTEFDESTKAMKTPYKVIHGRTYDTYEEYQQAIHDFLNENWSRGFIVSWHY